jgi:hypothetical protein
VDRAQFVEKLLEVARVAKEKCLSFTTNDGRSLARFDGRFFFLRHCIECRCWRLAAFTIAAGLGCGKEKADELIAIKMKGKEESVLHVLLKVIADMEDGFSLEFSLNAVWKKEGRQRCVASWEAVARLKLEECRRSLGDDINSHSAVGWCLGHWFVAVRTSFQNRVEDTVIFKPVNRVSFVIP